MENNYFDFYCNLLQGGEEQSECTKITKLCAEISLPIEVKSSANIGNITVLCTGEPSVKFRENRNICDIFVQQKICIEIPVCYKITADADSSRIGCECKRLQCK